MQFVKTIARSRACLLLVISAGCLMLLSLLLDPFKKTYPGEKPFFTDNSDTAAPKGPPPAPDHLLDELQESLDLIDTHDKTPKVEMDGSTCHLRTDELKIRRCSSELRTDCIRKKMSRNLRDRLADLRRNHHLRIDPSYRQVLHDLEKQIKGYYHLVIVSALSSNHYLESQAMLKDLHEKIFPIVPSLKLVVYDIGLTAEEHEEYRKLCRCQLIKFPFEKLPPFCRTLKCFCWKPFVIRAHLANGDMVMWNDASVRYNGIPEHFLGALNRTLMYGVQQNHVKAQPKIPFRAIPPVFHHFGFPPCAFKDFHNAASNWAIYRNSPLIEHAVLDVWTACGLNMTCTCAGYHKKDSSLNGDFKVVFKRPQTAVAIILARLWMEDYSAVAAIQKSFTLKRAHRLEYFKELKEKNMRPENK